MTADIYERRNYILTSVLAVLLFVSPLLYVGLLRDPSDLPRYAALAFIICVLGIVYVAYWFKGAERVSYTPVLVFAFIYLVLAGVSGQWAVEPSTNIVYAIRLLCYVGLFFIALQISSERGIRILITVSLYSAALTALIGLLQNHGLNFLELRGYVHKIGGTFIFKNHMALYLDLIIPAGFAILLASKNKFQKYAIAVSLSLCLLYILNSHTRGSYLALIVAGMLALLCYAGFPAVRTNIKQRFAENKWILVAIILAVVAAAQLPGKGDKYERRGTYAGDSLDTSSRDRLTAYANALSLIGEKPLLGSGYGTFWKAFRPFTNHPDVIRRSDENIVLYRLHNDLLQIIVELGLAGGVLALLIIALTYKYGVNILRKEQDAGGQLLLFGILLSLSASLAHSMVDFPLLKPSSAEQFWVYLGLVSGLYASKQSSAVTVEKTWIKFSSAVFVALLTLSLAVYYRAYITGSYYARQAEVSLKNKNCHDAMNFIDKSENAFRHDFFVHKLRVTIHLTCNTNMTSLYEVLNEELRWDNTDTAALLKRGYILLASNYFDRAEKDFQQVMYLIPHRPSGYVGEAYVLVARGDTKEAEKLLGLLQKRFPDDPGVKRVSEQLDASRQGKTQ